MQDTAAPETTLTIMAGAQSKITSFIDKGVRVLSVFFKKKITRAYIALVSGEPFAALYNTITHFYIALMSKDRFTALYNPYY